jgi:thiol-disulfide isomerase/thioredoxin
MKKILLFSLVLSPLLLFAQTSWKILATPASPQPGDVIRVEYNWLEGPLAKASEVEILALESDGEKPVDKEVSFQNIGNKLVATFTTSPEARVAYVAFYGDERVDNNKGEGFFISLYNAGGQVLPESKAAQATLYRNFGVLELNRKAAVSLDLLKQAFGQQPELRLNPKYFPTYVNSHLAANRNSEEAKVEMLTFLAELENIQKADEKTLNALGDLYSRLSPEKAKTLKDKTVAAFPKGLLAKTARLNQVKMEPDLNKRLASLGDFSKEFPAETDRERQLVETAYMEMMDAVAKTKEWKIFDAIAAKAQPGTRASAYNNLAWDWAEKGEELARAKTLAAEAVEQARLEMAAPSEPKPATMSQKAWEMRRKNAYAMYADTYAFVLDKSGEPMKAAKYQAEAVKINDFGNIEFNEHFTEYLERAGSPDLRHQLEGFILKGAASAKMKEQFKKLYVAEDKSNAGYLAYVAKLEEVARTNRKENLLNEMLDDPAPAFALKNLDGKNVSLESLRGKVVVVDFWATWCGPCKSSFPGMQQTLDKYKNDPNVAFVFVDTWEKVDDKEKNAANFIKANNYTFNVLMDNDNQVVASFGVSGIPTKFVVDKQGKIRFKSIGYAGSTDALVDELSLMIEVAKGQP